MKTRSIRRRLGGALAAGAIATCSAASAQTTCMTTQHIFVYEDANQWFQAGSEFLECEASADAINACTAVWGDNFDFAVVWTTTPKVGTGAAAFFTRLFNDTQGLGDIPIINSRAQAHVNGSRVEGFAVMYNIERFAGTPQAVGLVAHEIGHRWGVALPPLSGNRPVEGELTCGTGQHWNHRFFQGEAATDTFLGNRRKKGSCWELDTITRNPDTGGIFSVVELYLMGYISPAEVDSLRASSKRLYFTDTASCTLTQKYCGPSTSWSSADIIAVAGPRSPDHTQARKHHRVAWIVVHQPGTPPTATQLAAYRDAANAWSAEFLTSTLQRGTMNGQLFPDANCDGTPDYFDCNGNGIPDSQDISTGASQDANSNGRPDECDFFGEDCNNNQVPDDQELNFSTDCEQDGVLDECEFHDCNNNTTHDECDIVFGTSQDANSNWIPDECEGGGGAPVMGGPVVTRVSAGPHTISCSSVYFTHLMRCPADIDGDGDADAADLHAAVDVALSGEADLFESVTAWFAGCR